MCNKKRTGLTKNRLKKENLFTENFDLFNIFKTLAALSGSDGAHAEQHKEAAPTAPDARSAQKEETPARNVMADVITRHEQMAYKIKGRG